MKKVLFIFLSSLIVLIISIVTGCGMPQISFQSSSSDGAAPLMVTFTNGTKIKADSSILFDWDFGDGEKMTGTKITDSISHKYTVAGNYTH